MESLSYAGLRSNDVGMSLGTVTAEQGSIPLHEFVVKDKYMHCMSLTHYILVCTVCMQNAQSDYRKL